jgi:hypothetical protein
MEKVTGDSGAGAPHTGGMGDAPLLSGPVGFPVFPDNADRGAEDDHCAKPEAGIFFAPIVPS